MVTKDFNAQFYTVDEKLTRDNFVGRLYCLGSSTLQSGTQNKEKVLIIDYEPDKLLGNNVAITTSRISVMQKDGGVFMKRALPMG